MPKPNRFQKTAQRCITIVSFNYILVLHVTVKCIIVITIKRQRSISGKNHNQSNQKLKRTEHRKLI